MGIVQFLPVALLASLVDGVLLWGIRSFMQILDGSSFFSLGEWLLFMVALCALRLLLLLGKVRISQSLVYGMGAGILACFLHLLRNLSPRFFHREGCESMVEASFESTQVLQNNGMVLYQGIQAVLQLAVFFPVLLYISWPLTVFLFVAVVPLVSVLQRKLHGMGPAEESLLFARSQFRTDLGMARRLFKNWSSPFERAQVSSELMRGVKNLKIQGQSISIRKDALSQVVEMTSVLSMVAVLSFCAWLISKGWMDGEGLVLFCSAVLLCYKPVKECARVMPQFRLALSSYRVLESFEKLPRKQTEKKEVSKKQICTKQAGAELVESIQVETDSEETDLLEIHQGCFGYSEPVFKNLEVAWSTLKPVLLRGQNGVGKSTLLRLIAGLEEWELGQMLVPSLVLKGGIFFVPQNLELPPWRLLNMLLEQNPSAEVERFIGAAKAERLLKREGLSGGERSRVALVWALASRCKVLLLDEPLAAVALDDREPLLDEFLKVAHALGKWVVVSSHDPLSVIMEERFFVVRM